MVDCDRTDHGKRGENEGVNVRVIMKMLLKGQSSNSDILPTATKLEEKARMVAEEEVERDDAEVKAKKSQADRRFGRRRRDRLGA